MKKIAKVLPVIAAAALMVACGGSKMNYENLVSQKWVLDKVEHSDSSAQITVPANLTIEFSDSSRVFGRGPCNGFFGPYTVTDDNIKFGNLASTMAYCLQMPFESSYFGWLDKVATFKATEHTLTLRDADGKISLHYKSMDKAQSN